MLATLPGTKVRAAGCADDVTGVHRIGATDITITDDATFFYVTDGFNFFAVLKTSGAFGVNAIVLPGSGIAVHIGTSGADTIDALSSHPGVTNVIFGLEGDDTIYGGLVDDWVYAGCGDDYVETYSGKDEVWLGKGDDIAFLMEGDDLCYGEEGDDEIYGGWGDDLIYGGEDNDFIDAEDGFDEVFGEAKPTGHGKAPAKTPEKPSDDKANRQD